MSHVWLPILVFPTIYRQVRVVEEEAEKKVAELQAEVDAYAMTYAKDADRSPANKSSACARSPKADRCFNTQKFARQKSQIRKASRRNYRESGSTGKTIFLSAAKGEKLF